MMSIHPFPNFPVETGKGIYIALRLRQEDDHPILHVH
jgi:hypothetical protein